MSANQVMLPFECHPEHTEEGDYFTTGSNMIMLSGG
jgi:hypothetical protein